MPATTLEEVPSLVLTSVVSKSSWWDGRWQHRGQRLFKRRYWGPPLFFLPGSCGPHSCPAGYKHTGVGGGVGRRMGGGNSPSPRPGPWSPFRKNQGFWSHLSPWLWGWRQTGKGEDLKGNTLLGRNVLSNTNVNMIYATPTDRLLLFLWLGNTGWGGGLGVYYLSSIPGGAVIRGWSCSSIWSTNHSLETVPRQPIRRCWQYFPGTFFLDV